MSEHQVDCPLCPDRARLYLKNHVYPKDPRVVRRIYTGACGHWDYRESKNR